MIPLEDSLQTCSRSQSFTREQGSSFERAAKREKDKDDEEVVEFSKGGEGKLAAEYGNMTKY